MKQFYKSQLITTQKSNTMAMPILWWLVCEDIISQYFPHFICNIASEVVV